MLRLQGALAGVCSVYAARVPLIGNRLFWVYRSLLDARVSDWAPAMIRATLTALESEFDGAPDSPIGLCVLIADADTRQRHPEAAWSEPPLVYAGYVSDGRQVRLGYFRDAVVTHAPGASS